MNFGHIKLALIITGISIISAIGTTIWTLTQDNHLQTGNLYFAKISSQEINKIQINQPKLTITLLQEDNLWKVAEADYYYADFNIIHNLLNNIKSARISSQLKDKAKENQPQQISISLFNSQGQEIDYTNISMTEDELQDTKVYRPNDKDIYVLDKTFTLPDQISSWTNQPFLQVSVKDIQQITLKENKYYRKNQTYDFINKDKTLINKQELNNLLKKLQYVSYEQVMSAQNFDDTKYPQKRNIQIIDFNGLIRDIEILTDTQEYWVKQTFSTTPLPTINTNDYIRNNSFLYDGWYFRLSPTMGKLLYSYANG